MQQTRCRDDRHQFRQLCCFVSVDTQGRELPGRDEDACLQGTDGFVVRLDARGEGTLQRLHVPRHGAQAFVELDSQLLHLSGALGQRFLLPSQSHHAQQADEGGRRGQQDPIGHGVFLQGGIRFVRR